MFNLNINGNNINTIDVIKVTANTYFTVTNGEIFMLFPADITATSVYAIASCVSVSISGMGSSGYNVWFGTPIQIIITSSTTIKSGTGISRAYQVGQKYEMGFIGSDWGYGSVDIDTTTTQYGIGVNTISTPLGTTTIRVKANKDVWLFRPCK